MAERISNSTRKHVRTLKAGLRREITPQRAQHEPSFWVQTEEILSLSFPNYSEIYAPHTQILKEFFTIKIQTANDANQRREELKKFSEKHKKDILDTLKPAFVAINGIIENQAF